LSDRANVLLIGATLDRLNAATAASRPVVPFALSSSAASDGAIAIGDHAMPPENSAIATLGWIARAKAIACKGYYGEAENWFAANRAPERAQRIFKAAIGAGSTADARIDVRWGR